MGSHEPARMLWCRWFIHIVSSKSASRKTCKCPLSHLRRWTGHPIDGKAVSLIPDPCVLHADMSLIKILNPKQPWRLHYWCEKVQTFYLHSAQKTLCGYKSCGIQVFTLATSWLCYWLLRERCAIYGYCFVDLDHAWGNGSWMSPMVVIFHLPPHLLPFPTFSSATTPAWSLSGWMRNSVHFEPCSFLQHDSPRSYNGVGTLAVGVSFLSSVTGTQSRQTKLAIAAKPLEKHYS